MPQDIDTTALRDFRNYYPVGTPPEALTIKPFQCSQGDNLYPTHPSQTLKTYHIYDRAGYDSRQLDGRDDTCILSQIHDGRPNARPRSQALINRVIAQAEQTGRRIPCQLGDYVHRVMLSDTYIDVCGNYYRGVKSMQFLESQENMGTLFSPGRTNYRVTDSRFNERYDGHTYPVARTEFVFLAELLPGDMGRITSERRRARQTHQLDRAGRIFTLID